MTNLRGQRALAGKVLKRGHTAVWIDPERYAQVSSAITRDDIKNLISGGAIKARKVVGTSRGRARALAHRKRRGQRAGPGRRKGTANARFNSKTVWINKIRLQRKYLAKLRDDGYISASTYRVLYRQAKGNLFRSVRYLSNHIRESGMTEKRIPELK